MNKSHLLIMCTAISTAFPAIAVPLPPKTTHTHPRFNDLAQQCSRGVHPNTLQAVARVESSFNPYAIGVVKSSLKRQPQTYAEAVATAKSLHAQGKNFSMGLMQVNRYNLAAYGLNYETVFEPCKNINVGAKILKDCFDRAGGKGQMALKKAFSCYYSGNFKFGFKSDFKGQPSYVAKVILAAMDNSPHQTIKYSGSLKVNHSATDLSKNQSVASVPPIQQAQRQPETAQYTTMPAEYQNTQHPVSDEKPVVLAAQKPPPSPPEWDVFAYAEYRGKYGGNKPEWDISP